MTISAGIEDRRDPRAFPKLRDEHDQKGDPGSKGSNTVDDHALECAFAALSLPVHHHAGLREREGKKGPDGKERDQAVGYAAEDDEQERGEADQGNDAVGVEQTAAADLEDVGQIVVHARWHA